jgi:sarcosine oxidase, subunit gamma
MPELIRTLIEQSALPAGGRVYGDFLRLAVLPPRTTLRLQLALKSQKSLAKLRIAGRALPETMNTWSGEEPVICRIAPDTWLLLSAVQDGAVLADAAHMACAKRSCAVTDVSDANVTILVEGLRAIDILIRGCALDIASLAGDACTRTRFAQLPIVLRRVTTDRFELLADRAVAKYLFDWLQDAAAVAGVT